MKKKQLTALGAMIVIIFTACANPFSPEKKAEVPVVTLNVTPVSPYILGDGVTITASASTGDGGTLSYQWFRNNQNNSESGELISNAT